MNFNQAMAFIRDHGVVLESARGPVPRMTEIIAGEAITGSWWAHPKGHAIFAVFAKIKESPDVLVCRLVEGKITYVHRRLWPALVRLADRFGTASLAQVSDEHTSAGHHLSRRVPFPNWVPADVIVTARGLDERQALTALGGWATSPKKTKKKMRTRGAHA
jgi:hypothetical protein